MNCFDDLSDQELLQWASHARGDLNPPREGGRPASTRNRNINAGWNPLKKDSDAFSLLIDLGLKLEFPLYQKEAVAGYWSGNSIAYMRVPFGRSSNAATRRAIVLAAAWLGQLAVYDEENREKEIAAGRL